MAIVENEFPWPRGVRLVAAWLLVLVWNLFKVGFMFLTGSIVAEGTRLLFPVWAKKLHRMPGLGFFKEYELTYQLDGALIFALCVICVVFASWGIFFDRLLKATRRERTIADYIALYETIGERIALAAGAVLSVVDAVLCYAAMNEMSWGTGLFSFTSLLATAAYVSLVVLFAFISVLLRHKANSI